jgi:chloride channel protein, CIC family
MEASGLGTYSLACRTCPRSPSPTWPSSAGPWSSGWSRPWSAPGSAFSEVLFSGQNALGPLISNSATYSVGALVLLVACKGLAYGVPLAGFRGGPVFPAMFLGAAGGIALSHLPGLPLVPGVAMGIGAMSVVLLRLPLTSVLLATLLLAEDGLAVMPLVIVAVAVAYVASARLTPPATATPAAPTTATPAEARVQASPTPAQRPVSPEHKR